MSEKTKKGFHIHEYLIVIFMLLLACVLTYVIPAGEYSTIVNEAGKRWLIRMDPFYRKYTGQSDTHA